MIRENIDKGWKFAKGTYSVYNLLIPNNNLVNLPHDFTIQSEVDPQAPGGKEAGFYKGGIGNYTKSLFIPNEWEGKRILIEFDGSFMNTEVSLNGHLVTMHPYGYTPFHADITPYVNYGRDNRLLVVVNNSAPETGRWYSGSGIYRHVDLLTASKVHLAPWSTFMHTDRVEDGTAYLTAEVTVENHSDTEVRERITITMAKEHSKETAGLGYVFVTVPAHSKATGKVAMVVKNAMIWDLNSPILYNVTAQLGKEEIIDCDNTLFGIRTISVDRECGFKLNGRSLKLKGGCVHHDNGILGATSFYDSEYRKMKLHKENGFNAIRLAHNPPSRDLLEACDRLGLLVINEAFDVWRMQKNMNDYHLYFDAWWKKDMEAFMTRDRNHPCIIMWSTGNEITERHGLGEGYQLAAELASYARSLDSTRLITNALPVPFNGMNDDDMMNIFAEWAKIKSTDSVQNLGTEFSNAVLSERSEQFVAPLDVVGYNYMEYRYERDGIEYPNRIICGTESYPKNIDIVWQEVMKYNYVIGDFTWTSYDYIGEAGLGIAHYTEENLQTNPMQGPPVQYPWRLAYGADFDLCGFDRVQLHFRKIVWGSDETYIAVHNPANANKKEFIGRWGWTESYNVWTFDGYENKPTKVDVFSAADEVELLINSISVGRKPAGKENRYKAQFEVVYEPGRLVAVSYKNGNEISRQELVTVGRASGVKITLEQEKAISNGHSLIYALVEIVDNDGRRVPFGDWKAKAEVIGAGDLAAFGTGRPVTEENYTKGEFTSFEGRYQAVIRSGYEPGEVVLKVLVEGLGEAQAVINVI